MGAGLSYVKASNLEGRIPEANGAASGPSAARCPASSLTATAAPVPHQAVVTGSRHLIGSVGAHPPVVVYGEHAHYGVGRAIGELGIGSDHAVAVLSQGFRMDPVALEQTLDRPRRGDSWITSTVLDGRRVLRATLMNPRATPADLERVLDGLEKLGAELSPQHA